MKNIKRFQMFLLIAFLSIFFALSVHLVFASNGNEGKVACSGRWSYPPLSVGGKDGVLYAEATYEFDAQCKPVLVSEMRLDYIPSWINEPTQQPVDVKTVQITPPAKDGGGSDVILAVNTCHVKTFEEDVVGIDMISVQNDQSYSWNGSTVTLSSGSVSATTYLSWWYRISGPTGTSGYNSPSVAWARGNARFNCNGGPFCGGGPMYAITLYNNMTVSASGGCAGYGTHSGTIVPAGRVQYSVWRT